jgi:hypothetical protein
VFYKEQKILTTTLQGNDCSKHTNSVVKQQRTMIARPSTSDLSSWTKLFLMQSSLEQILKCNFSNRNQHMMDDEPHITKETFKFISPQDPQLALRDYPISPTMKKK